MSVVKRLLLYLMAAFYALGGTMHFVRADWYLAMMPPYLPWPLMLVVLSGVAEIAGGIGVLIPKTRRLAAWGLIVLLVAVFPANLYIAMENVPVFGATEGPGVLGWLRLPLQLVFILWAYQYTRD